MKFLTSFPLAIYPFTYYPLLATRTVALTDSTAPLIFKLDYRFAILALNFFDCF